ncbi:hypothetical protein [Candidatus Chloroploca asiatica]|uniref:Glycosidase n=1 Tax=Candidatus Chloroploca asiatica TaxID=1506545 RepID=A0A2H3L0V3_9CHLR|nr:hypothetical protein [Candidatus Chloroploca asiatica]PDV98284.1 hypothetical protein A9Q02_22385 [Candidatus Chloroploca asiatica]
MTMGENSHELNMMIRHEYRASDLMPGTWQRAQPAQDFHVYNPALTRFRNRLLMAYRVDFGYEKPFRVATAICVLDERLRVVPGSVVALSDTITSEATNHYDARFLVFGDRLFVHFNNDWNTVPNQIFLVELDPDTLQAQSPARLLELQGPRQPCEKNWLLFAHDGELFAIYQVAPHIVLHVDLAGSGPIRCRPVYRTAWDTTAYTRRYGELRGGTPPVRVGANYVSVFHSRTHAQRPTPVNSSRAAATLKHMPWFRQIKRWLREHFAPVRYYGGVYAFAAEPPFAPTFLRPTPILWPEHEGPRQRPTASHMAPRRVVYPCGLVHLDDGRWLVSYGIHDERAALRVFTRQEIEGDLERALQ